MTQAKFKAEIRFLAGGSYAFADDFETAVKKVMRIAHADWSGTFDLCGKPVDIHLTDRTSEPNRKITVTRIFPTIHFATSQELAIELAEVINLQSRAKRMTEDELYAASYHLQKLVKRAERTLERSDELDWFTDGHDEVIEKMLDLIEQAEDTIDDIIVNL